MRKIIAGVVVCLMAAVGLFACGGGGGGGGGGTPGTTATLTSIAVTPSSPSITQGNTVQFNATGSYSDGTTRDISSSVSWTTSNAGIAAISNGGLATGAGAGTVTIKAISGDIFGTRALIVTSANDTTNTVVQSNVVVLDTTTISNSTSTISTGSNVVTLSPTSQTSQISVGNILVSDQTSAFPNGALLKVTSVSQSGNQVVLNTTAATIEDVFQNTDLHVSQSLTTNSVVAATSLRKGVVLQKSSAMKSISAGVFSLSLTDVVLYDADGDTNTTNDQVVANGSITLEPSFDFSLSVNNAKLQKLSFTVNANETTQIAVSTQVSVNAQKTIELAKYNFPPLTIWAGWVPIVITPVLTVNVSLDGTVSYGISAGVTQNATLTAGLSYDGGTWTPINSLTNDFQFNQPAGSLDASFKVEAGPQLDLLLYGVVGPHADVNAYLELDITPLADPLWILYGGLSADLGVKVEVLSNVVADYSLTVIDYKKLLAQQSAGYSISGSVTSSGVGLSGVTITLSGAGSGTATTDTSGNYTLSGVANGTYTVTPSKSGYTFSLSSTSVTVSGANQTGKNFTATATLSTYSISGTIIDNNNAPLMGASVALSGAHTGSTTTDPSGNYSFTGLANGSYTITPTLTNYTFAPGSLSATVNGVNATGKNFTATAASPGANFKIPDTGQTTCYNSAGTIISCTGTGQDGAYTINPPSYTDNGNSTITDNVTGLVWQKQDDGVKKTWSDAITYCDNLTFGGQTDWRLPSEIELISIIDHGGYNPSINATYFPAVPLGYGSSYWSSTPHAIAASSAWYVDFFEGYSNNYLNVGTYYARCVRGGQSATQNLADNGNGTVTDSGTHLTWQQGESSTMTWEAALTYCEGLSLAGSSDWRLPNHKELLSLVDYTKATHPLINTTLFPGAISLDEYWSSTTRTGIDTDALVVYFNAGYSYSSFKTNTGVNARCVRGGQ